MWWLAVGRLSDVSCALVAEVQTEPTLMLGATSAEKGHNKSPGSQLFNPEQDIICSVPSVHEIWGWVNNLVVCDNYIITTLQDLLHQC